MKHWSQVRRLVCVCYCVLWCEYFLYLCVCLHSFVCVWVCLCGVFGECVNVGYVLVWCSVVWCICEFISTCVCCVFALVRVCWVVRMLVCLRKCPRVFVCCSVLMSVFIFNFFVLCKVSVMFYFPLRSCKLRYFIFPSSVYPFFFLILYTYLIFSSLILQLDGGVYSLAMLAALNCGTYVHYSTVQYRRESEVMWCVAI